MSSISLESKAKIPQKILEIITDTSSLLSISTTSSQSTDMVLNSCKQLGALSPIIDNSEDLLKSISDMIQNMEVSSVSLDQGIDTVCDLQERLQSIERENYYCSMPKSTSADSFASSVASEKQI